MSSESTLDFAALGLPAFLCKSLAAVGYEQPSPIQAQSIPVLLEGRDLLGLAQTGTGKTAAFALPLLARMNLSESKPQALILAPTRELAIQVSEAIQKYANGMRGFHIAPIYGGSSMGSQLQKLRRGVHVVVGTPGRVMDHLRRGTLDLSALQTVVLDEADEMLRMGFIDDVEWILEHTPKTRQVALFSATMPPAIKKITTNYLNDPVRIQIESKTKTVEKITQQFVLVNNNSRKLDALTRILEVESFDAAIMFVRTKTATVELAQKLEARGYSCAALNGDINQRQREMTIDQLKKGEVDLLIATDVAARGIDVPRVTHVINYDIPYDQEAYVHRIGRTGRAGREGKAILFINPRERRLLQSIEKNTGQKITEIRLPTSEELTQQRVQQFHESVLSVAAEQPLDEMHKLVTELVNASELPLTDIAAALAHLAQADKPLFVEKDRALDEPVKGRRESSDSREPRDRKGRDRAAGPRRKPGQKSDVEMETYRVAVGRNQGIKVGNLVGAIANEADLDSQFIGDIKLHDDYSLVQLPAGMPKAVFQLLKKVRVCSLPLNIEVATETMGHDSRGPKKPSRSKPAADKPVKRKPRKELGSEDF